MGPMAAEDDTIDFWFWHSPASAAPCGRIDLGLHSNALVFKVTKPVAWRGGRFRICAGFKKKFSSFPELSLPPLVVSRFKIQDSFIGICNNYNGIAYSLFTPAVFF